MQFRKFGNSYVIRLEKGDELIASLRKFVEREKVTGGFFYGLGAVRDVSLGYFDVEKKEYKEKSFEEDFELTSLVGDISFAGEKVIVHAHVTLANSEFGVFAGHLNRTTVTATVEVVFNPLSGKLEKEVDPDTGLNLLNLKG
jgi:predicted DNA-binding protein with PD1-like motif